MKMPMMPITVNPPSRLVPLAIPIFLYVGGAKRIAANAVPDLKRSFAAIRLAACMG